MKRRLFLVAVLGLGLGLTALAWAALDLPGRPLVRGHLGDVGVVMVLVAAFGLALPRLGLRGWIALAAGIAAATELAQALGLHGEGVVNELTLGATFDPFDLLAYAVGLALAAVLVQRPSDGPRRSAHESRPVARK